MGRHRTDYGGHPDPTISNAGDRLVRSDGSINHKGPARSPPRARFPQARSTTHYPPPVCRSLPDSGHRFCHRTSFEVEKNHLKSDKPQFFIVLTRFLHLDLSSLKKTLASANFLE